MSNDLMLPQVPDSKPQDPEDVSWALSTAEAMWARGDHAEGIKWVRRAAEAASEAEDDARALELAKAAADLAGMIARRTMQSSLELEEIAPAAPPPVPARPATATAGKSVTPPKTTSAPPAPKPLHKPVTPAPLPSRAAAPPAAKSKPLVAETKPSSPKPGNGPPSTRSLPGKKSTRRSRENLDNEARDAIPPGNSTAKLLAFDSGPDVLSETAETVTIQVPHRRRSRPELGSNDPTVVGHVNDIVRAASTDEVDSTTADGGANGGDRRTAGRPPQQGSKATLQGVGSRSGAKAGSLTNVIAATKSAAAPEPHDPAITTTQAVRVIVWRDASGVHVAPAGTVVSAITVDAVLVALEPSADLTAWLSSGEPGSPRR